MMKNTLCVILGIALGYVFAVGILAIAFPAPSLVGYGCEGASGPIYANEEDHFPVCKSIEVKGN